MLVSFFKRNRIQLNSCFFSVLFMLFLLMYSSESNAQRLEKKVPYKSIIGIGWNTVDDLFSWYDFSTFSESWHILPYPSSLNVEFFFNDALSLDFMASYNYYSRDKSYNDSIAGAGHFGSFDANLKLSFGFLVPNRIIDPFFYGGLSYTFREGYVNQHMAGLTAGYGITVKFSKHFGVQYRNTLNYSIYPSIFDENYNYMHHHLGLVLTLYDTRHGHRSFSKRKYSWINKRKRFRRRKVGRM